MILLFVGSLTLAFLFTLRPSGGWPACRLPPRCSKCRYDLSRCLTAPSCPECGTPIDSAITYTTPTPFTLDRRAFTRARVGTFVAVAYLLLARFIALQLVALSYYVGPWHNIDPYFLARTRELHTPLAQFDVLFLLTFAFAILPALFAVNRIRIALAIVTIAALADLARWIAIGLDII